MAPHPEEIRAFWNDRAREDALYFVDNRRTYRDRQQRDFWDVGAGLEKLLSTVGVEIGPDDTVLEIGCGVGRFTRSLAEHARHVIALDVSDVMLEQARRYNPHLDDQVSWVLGDGRSLGGIEDRSVDACVSTVVFQHLPDQRIAFDYVRELGRVLRPAGWAALQVSNQPGIHRYRASWKLRLGALVGLAPRGQNHPAWLGTAIELPALRQVAAEAALDVEQVWNEGTQYCTVLLRKLR